MRWPWSNPETRASATDAIVDAIVNTASGAGAPTVDSLAAVEVAAGLWSRAFGSATVNPQTVATSRLTPSVLAQIARELALRGDYLAVLDVDDDGVTLTPCASWDVQGGVRPASWRYKAQLAVPGGTVERNLTAEQVVHIRYAQRPRAPWRGCSPLAASPDTHALATWIERRLSEESRASTGYILATPDGASVPDSLKTLLKNLKGKLAIMETTAQGWGQGQMAAPSRKDYDTTRIGFMPAEGIAQLRRDVRADVFMAYGVPAGLTGTGGQQREAYRQFLASTISPVAKLVSESLGAALDTPELRLSFEDLRAADVVGIARAIKALIDAGYSKAEAETLLGLD